MSRSLLLLLAGLPLGGCSMAQVPDVGANVPDWVNERRTSETGQRTAPEALPDNAPTPDVPVILDAHQTSLQLRREALLQEVEGLAPVEPLDGETLREPLDDDQAASDQE